MTAIKIEKKKPFWPWVLGIGIAAFLVYYIGFKDQKETAPENLVAENLINVNENNVAVAAFVRFMEEDTMKMELDPTFANEAFIKLIDATNAMADEIHFDASSNMERVVKHVNKTFASSAGTSQANNFKRATDILTTTILKGMQQEKYPGLSNEFVELENASASINSEELTFDQKDVVKTFFQNTAKLLQKMN